MRTPRKRVTDWLRANHLNADDVPINAPIAITADTITVDLHRRDENGHLFLVNGRVATEQRTVPLRKPWPDGLYWPNLRGGS